MFIDMKIKKEEIKRTCPVCSKDTLEWVSGKADNSSQFYMCTECRLWVKITGMTAEEQESLAREGIGW